MIDAVPAPPGVIPQMKQPKPKDSGIKRWVKVAVILLLFVVALTIFQHLAKNQTVADLKNRVGLKFSSQKQQQEQHNAVLFIVGEEAIYQADFEQETKMYPSVITSEIEAALQEKLQDDSILLQEAGKQGLLVLESSFYNSPTKDYQTRLEKVALARNQLLNDNLQAQEGELVAIWFYNTEPAPMGYEAGKKVAFQKISALHKQVSTGEITMKEAGERIASDTSLAQVDPAYKTNAYDSFALVPGKKVVFEDTADQIIRTTKPGELTDVLVISDTVGENNTAQEALYLFAKIGNTTTADPTAIDAWLETVRPNYAIKSS